MGVLVGDQEGRIDDRSIGRSPVEVALSKSSVTAVPALSVCWCCGSRSLGAVIETPPIKEDA